MDVSLRAAWRNRSGESRARLIVYFGTLFGAGVLTLFWPSHINSYGLLFVAVAAVSGVANWVVTFTFVPDPLKHTRHDFLGWTLLIWFVGCSISFGILLLPESFWWQLCFVVGFWICYTAAFFLAIEAAIAGTEKGDRAADSDAFETDKSSAARLHEGDIGIAPAESGTSDISEPVTVSDNDRERKVASAEAAHEVASAEAHSDASDREKEPAELSTPIEQLPLQRLRLTAHREVLKHYHALIPTGINPRRTTALTHVIDKQLRLTNTSSEVTAIRDDLIDRLTKIDLRLRLKARYEADLDLFEDHIPPFQFRAYLRRFFCRTHELQDIKEAAAMQHEALDGFAGKVGHLREYKQRQRELQERLQEKEAKIDNEARERGYSHDLVEKQKLHARQEYRRAWRSLPSAHTFSHGEGSGNDPI